MFDALSDKLEGVFRTLRGQGSLSVSDVDAALREIRLALLEADVHFKVAKQFLDKVREKATGQEVLKSLTPAQAVIRIVRDEMVALLGGEEPPRLLTSSRLPSVILMAGLQGSGKTTTSASSGPSWRSREPSAPRLHRRVPAGRASSSAPMHQRRPQGPPSRRSRPAGGDPALRPRRVARGGHDFLIVDTAAGSTSTTSSMTELQQLKAVAQPSEVLYVADAMTGQDAVRARRSSTRRSASPGSSSASSTATPAAAPP